MKKVFAFLSVFALTIAFVGFGAKSANADDSLFTEDPTLKDGQIPVYIMDSIYTTFPAYYDYAKGGDEKWAGTSRMFPWNETRLQVKLIDEEGNFQVNANGNSEEYAIYFNGTSWAYDANGAGAGKQVLFYKEAVDADGNGKMENAEIKTGRMNEGKWSESQTFSSDSSLSHMRVNITGYDLYYNAFELYAANAGGKEDAAANQYNRMFVFDANGRMTRGIALDGTYLLPDAEGAQDVTIAPEFCYSDGVVTKITEDTVCDVEEITDEKTGEVTKKTQYITNRFVFQYFPAEEFDPETVNTVPYLSEGWDAQKWDYAFEEEDGYVCIAFVCGENSSKAGTFKLTAEQLAVYKDTCAAAGLPEPGDSTVRQMALTIIIPAGGWMYEHGYLDKIQNKTACIAVSEMFIDGYKYGRTVDEEGKGMSYITTHDFSAKPVYATDVVNNGVSYQLLEGQNTIEVLQGEVIQPYKNVVYTGMAKYWSTPNDFTSYKADSSALELYMKLDGTTVVQPNTGYASHAEMAEAFMADVNAYLAKKKGFALNAETGAYEKTAEDGTVTTYVPVATPTLPAGSDEAAAKAAIGGTTGPWYTAINYEVAHMTDGNDSFCENEEMWAKWSWMFEYMNISLDPAASGIDMEKRIVGSPGNFTYTLWAFLAEAPLMSGWPSSKVDWSNGKASSWLDTRTNIEKWEQFSIDTSVVPVDTNYVVEYTVYNPNTDLKSSVTLTYVVVDEYTPILEVNTNNLIYAPTVVGERVEIKPIDEYAFCNAYNARYNGVSIKGDSISYKIHYTSDTLDFDAPTEGEHVVTAKVYNQTKWVEKSFVVSIEDVTAPRAYAVASVTIGVGEYFNVLDGVIYAYDNVDGNLLDRNRSNWYADVSPKALNIQKVGKYEVVLEIWDEMGNTCEVSYVVNVVSNDVNKELAGAIAANKQTIDSIEGLVIEQFEAVAEQFEAINEQFEAINDKFAEIDGKFDAVNGKVDGVAGKVDGVQGDLDALEGKVDGVAGKVDGVAGKVDGVQEDLDAANGDIDALNGKVDKVQAEFDSKCGSKNALIVQFLAATSLLVVFLKKKH